MSCLAVLALVCMSMVSSVQAAAAHSNGTVEPTALHTYAVVAL